MPRPLRAAPGGLVYHVLNRANAQRRIFEREGDYSAFERTLAEVQERIPMRILAWCVMPNHWHLVLWPRLDGDLSEQWPVTRPHDWTAYANQVETSLETEAVRRCARRSTPYGHTPWVQGVAKKLGLECTLRPRGRPKKGS